MSKSETQLPTLIPRETLFGNPSRTSPQLSRDGKYIAYIAPVDTLRAKSNGDSEDTAFAARINYYLSADK